MSEADKLLQQLHPTESCSSKNECNNNFNRDRTTGKNIQLNMPTNILGQSCDGVGSLAGHYNIQPIYNISNSSEESSNHDSSNNSDCNSGYDSSNSGNINTSSSPSPPSMVAILERAKQQILSRTDNVSPYSCVDIVGPMNSTKSGRDCDKFPFQRNLVNNLGISCSDDSNSAGQVVRPYIRFDLPDVLAENSASTDTSAGQVVSSYIRFDSPDVLGNACTPVLNLPDAEKCVPKMSKDGYVDHNKLQAGVLYVQKEVDKCQTCLAPPDASVQPGPRPVSTLVNVPPHFFGSLSLLDDSTAFTTEL